MPVPNLRSLDLVAGQWNGQQAVVPRDYEGLLETPLLLPLPVFLVVLFLDGRREALDVQIEYARLTGGQILPRVDLDRIIADLDAHHLLETPRQALLAAYRMAPHRPAAQVLFLDHLTHGRPVTILPLLCSSFEQWCGAGSPSELPEVESFILALRRALAAETRPVLVIGRVAAGDAEGFWQAVMTDGNRRRVCGLSAIYTVPRVLTPVRAHVLEYAQGEDPAGGLVGFAACGLDGVTTSDG